MPPYPGKDASQSDHVLADAIDENGALRDTSAEVEQLIGFDSIAFAESIQPPGEADPMVGLAIHVMHSRNKKRVLLENGDSTLVNKTARYERIMGGLGFERVLDLPIDRPATSHSEAYRDALTVWARRDGLVLCYDTYGGLDRQEGAEVNSANLHFVWRPAPENFSFPPGGSGGFKVDDGKEYPLSEDIGRDRLVFVGHVDAREAIAHKIRRMEETGRFEPVWAQGLLHHRYGFLLVGQDYPGRDGERLPFEEQTRMLDERRQERLAMLPDWVREMIGAGEPAPEPTVPRGRVP